MKKLKILHAVIFFVSVILAGILSFAPAESLAVEGFTQFHDPEAPRVVDRAGLFSESFETQIMNTIREYSLRYKMDFVVLTVDGYSPSEFGQAVADYYKSSPWGCEFGDYVSDFYDYNGYGIGNSFNGIIFGVNMERDNHEYWFTTTGDAIALFEDEIPGLKRKVQPMLSAGDYEKAVTTFLEYSAEVAERLLSSMQYDFGDVSAALSGLLYDDAGVLSDGAKSAASGLLSSVRDRYGCDCAVMLVDSYGAAEFGEEVSAYYEERGSGYSLNDYAADVYNSRGFGSGPLRDGVIIVLRLGLHGELNEAGCYASGLASKYGFNKAGEIAEYVKNDGSPDEMVLSCADYLDLVFNYEKNGLLPALSSDGSDHREAAGRVIDGAGMIQDSYETKLAKKLDKMVKKYKMDFVVLTTYGCDVREFGRDRVIAGNHGFYGTTYDGYDYGRDFFNYYGYGLSEQEPSGVILVINSNPADPGFFISAIGGAASRFSDERLSDLEDAIRTSVPSTPVLSGKTTKINKALNKYTRYLKSYLVLKHYPLSVGSVVVILLAAAVLSFIFNVGVLSESSPAASPAPGASYIPPSGVDIRDKKEVYIRTDTTKVVHVSSSSGGGGRSGGGYSHGGGSSGVSHGGGGGRF